MRSRIAIITTLVLGFAFSGAGVGLAVVGVDSQATTPADQQYDRPANNTASPTLAPTTDSVEEANEVESQTDQGENPGVAGDTDQQGDDGVAGVDDTQETRQLGAGQGGEELPFTGFAAIPVLLMGLALLSAGFVMRRRSTN